MVGIRDVAREANAHVSAVSRILNAKPHTYSKDTEKRVLAAAQKLGYRPRAYAQSMRTGRYNQVVILAAMRGSGLQEGMRWGIYNKLNEHGIRLGIGYVEDEHFEAEAKLSAFLTSWASDGFLLAYLNGAPEPLLDYLDRYRIPEVSLNLDQPYNCVYPQDREAAIFATETLIKLGHQRIAYVDGYSDQSQPLHYSRAARKGGYLETLAQHSLRPYLAEANNQSFEDTIEHVWKKWSPKERPTAFLSYSHNVAWHLYIEAYREGLEVPRDLSILSFADHQIRDLGIPFTFLRIPFEQVGEVATEMLLKKIEHPQQRHASIGVPMKLLEEGNTLAPPPPGS